MGSKCQDHRLYRHFLSLLLRNSGNEHQNNPLLSAETVRHSSAYITIYSYHYTVARNAVLDTQEYTSSFKTARSLTRCIVDY